MPLQPQTPITRLRPPEAGNAYGNDEPDWPNATSQPYTVHWSPQGGSEQVGDEPSTTSRVKLFAWPPFDLVETDRVVGPDGETYAVDGEVLRSYHPRTGQLHHVRAYLRRVAISG